MSVFGSVQAPPPDPIFGVSEKFNASPLTRKYSLTVGVYRTEEGKPYTFPAVAKAEDIILHKYSKDYLPMKGYAPFVEEARKVLWGEEVLSKYGPQIASVQSCAGTGALFLTSKFCKMHLNIPKVLLANPSWPNYKQIFGEFGHELGFFPWLKGNRLDIEGIVQSLREFPEGCLVVLQVVANNPTGTDPTTSEWHQIFDIVNEKHHIILFDFAYMGFASGDAETDCQIVREYAKMGRQFFVAFSFSKCMGLYGERIGCCHAVCSTKEEAAAVSGQLARIGRMSWSVPPENGAYIAHEVLSNPELHKEWLEELHEISMRVIELRKKLCQLLEEKTGKDWKFICEQHGMFAFTFLTPEQVGKLANEGVFIPNSGRVTIPALNSENIEFVADAIAKAIQ
ncbi:aminotransferase, classes I and II family protein [Histomonas meleagridis]|uniref:aminotransferase, classes I and II family protein n=1 Tax=Histomonas meleagridis TaxID=135588 RepID=UPI003559D001|nr:aminotransferase, classes I and II family protein [Histomonas meleagridis]KAH0804974.1 aminotransferase, classes I and II family protein [Histomonas meleagridis]